MATTHSLHSINAHDIATVLSDMHIEAIRNNAELGGADIAERLKKLREVAWSVPQKSAHIQPDHSKVFAAAIEGLDDKSRTLLLDAYAQMGHLNEMANLAARENYFLAAKTKGRGAPGGVWEFVEKEQDTKRAVEKLNQPVFEVVMTAHPTNVNSLESINAQHDLGMVLNRFMRGKEGITANDVQKAVADYAKSPLLMKDEKGNPKNFTVRDETQMVINALTNIYNDMPRIYGEYDDAFKDKPDYKPQDLKLNMRLKSWGSAGDKDGNTNITSDKTLEAIALHTHAILGNYLKDIDKIAADPKMAEWKGKLQTAYNALKDDILPAMEQLRNDHDAERMPLVAQVQADEKKIKEKGGLPKEFTSPRAKEFSERFDALSKRLADVRSILKINDFRHDLEELHSKATDRKFKADTLDLLRKSRAFGFEFAKIEYRETAEEYARVVDLIAADQHLPHDDAIKRSEALTKILQDPEKASKLYAKQREKIIEKGAGVPYNKNQPAPIAYHTMKRMELTRDFPDMFEDNVLAECGAGAEKETKEYIKAQGAANMLEAQFVQQAAMARDGRRPVLGIVPLFEEPDTMKNIDDIIKGAYDNKAYQQHLKLVADTRHEGNVTQQVQIAQSDNARRAGIPAARAFIHEAAKKLAALNNQYGINGQLYIGGSISDAYRNGVRALSASVNAFNMHKFAKFTFQGGDMLNFFNTPFSNARLFTRQFTHAAGKLEQTTDGEWKIIQDPQKVNNVYDTIAINALKKALPDYRTQDFTPEGLGMLLAAIRYTRETAAGGATSRGANRPGQSQGDSATLSPVDINTLRTIGFSEAMQHNDLLPSWIGAQTLSQHLRESIVEQLDETVRKSAGGWDFSQEEKDALMALKAEKNAPANKMFDPEWLHELYVRKSPTFCDAMDKIAYGLAMTDMDRLERRLNKAIAKIPAEQKYLADDLKYYVAHLKDSYKVTASMAYSALTGKVLDTGAWRPHAGNETITRYNSEHAKMAAALTEALNERGGIAPEIHRKLQYRSFPMYLKEHDVPLSAYDDRSVHAALDTVVHGRIPKVDDIAYGVALRGTLKDKSLALAPVVPLAPIERTKPLGDKRFTVGNSGQEHLL